MREVEVKFSVPDPAVVLAALAERGVVFGEPVLQDDQAYAPRGWSFGDPKVGVPFLRLRTVEGRHSFTLKQPTVNEQACVEHESEVADREEMHQAFLRMGFHPTVRILKVRRSARVGDLTVCVDEVAGVGAFLELERLVAGAERAEDVQAELAAFVGDLGVAAARTSQTYDSLVRAA